MLKGNVSFDDRTTKQSAELSRASATAEGEFGMQMLSYGCTRLEIGLQSTYEDVARDTNRGHTVAAVGECFQMAKNAGFKVRTDCALHKPFPGN